MRLYEDIGFIGKPERLANGYRFFTTFHIKQMKVARLALKGEIIQNGLRKKAVQIIRLCANCDYKTAILQAHDYDAMLENEITKAKRAIAIVNDILRNKYSANQFDQANQSLLTRKKTAELLDITIDTLRNWELNGLLKAKRKENGYRIYNDEDIDVLRIISTLRCANYSLSAILRLLNTLRKETEADVEHILNTPRENDDIVSVCDRLILSLTETRHDVKKMLVLLDEMSEK